MIPSALCSLKESCEVKGRRSSCKSGYIHCFRNSSAWRPKLQLHGTDMRVQAIRPSASTISLDIKSRWGKSPACIPHGACFPSGFVAWTSWGFRAWSRSWRIKHQTGSCSRSVHDPYTQKVRKVGVRVVRIGKHENGWLSSELIV